MFRKILLLLVVLIYGAEAHADIFGGCYLSDNFGQISVNSVVVRPVSAACDSLCTNQCSYFSVKSPQTGMEINQDLIDACNINCRSGATFQSEIRKINASPTNFQEFAQGCLDSAGNVIAPNATGSNCINLTYSRSACEQGTSTLLDIDNRATNANLSFYAGQNTSMVLLPGVMNQINMCGQSTTLLIPPVYTTAVARTHTNSNTRSSWSAINAAPTDTGIDIIDGDMLTIHHYGNFSSNSSIANKSRAPINDFLYLALSPDGTFTNIQNYNDMTILPSNVLKMVSLCMNVIGGVVGSNITPYCSAQTVMSGPWGMKAMLSTIRNLRDTRISGNINSSFACSSAANQGSLASLPVSASMAGWLNTWAACDPASLGNVQNPWKAVDDMSIDAFDRHYYYAGYINTGNASTFKRLGVMHGDGSWIQPSDNANLNLTPSGSLISDRNAFNDNLGGQTVAISRKGCAFTNGQRLIYTFSFEPPDITQPFVVGQQSNPNGSTPWALVPPDVINGKNTIPVPLIPGTLTQAASNSTQAVTSASHPLNLYLAIEDWTQQEIDARINPTGTNIDQTRAALFNHSNQFGSYSIAVSQATPTWYQSIISEQIRYFENYFFYGTSRGPGVVPSIFNSIVTDSGFITVVNTMLVLYVAFTGIFFLMGSIQMTSKELITRGVKIGIIVQLISPGSWAFFNTYLFNAMIGGGKDLVALVIANIGGTGVTTSMIQADFGNAFAIFDRLISLCTSHVVHIKVTALIFSGLTGVVYWIVGFIVLIVTFIVVVRCTIIYLVCITGIAILLAVSPVFITFMLFTFTFKMFEAWLKLILSFMIQPVFLFTAQAILSMALCFTIMSALSYTVCEICFLRFYLPFNLVDVCVIPGLKTLYSAFQPSGALSAPLRMISPLFCALILVHAMNAFCSIAPNLANMIVGGFMSAVSAAGAEGAGNPFSNVMSSGASVLGVDQGAMGARKNLKNTLDTASKVVRPITNAAKMAYNKVKGSEAEAGAGAGAGAPVATERAGNGPGGGGPGLGAIEGLGGGGGLAGSGGLDNSSSTGNIMDSLVRPEADDRPRAATDAKADAEPEGDAAPGAVPLPRDENI